MSTLDEIDEAISRLPEPEIEELAAWLGHRLTKREVAASELKPDFVGRAKSVWGEVPEGSPLSELVSQTRG